MEVIRKVMGIPRKSSFENDAVPKNIGIKGFEFYFPKNYVDLADLEQFDNEIGKYTKGRGQKEMSFCTDCEDAVSMALTVTSALLENYEIDTKTIGYLCVGTESLVDKSKSIKTSLMRLFGDNHDIGGVDMKNACYGGTEAIFGAVDWIQANYDTEKRFAIAVLVDIAVYGEKTARSTGGASAIAFLIGPDAPISFEKGLRAYYMDDITDFYKPVGGISSEYPVVNGTDSIKAYCQALDQCYKAYNQRVVRIQQTETSIQDFYAVMFHCPYYRLIQKAFARLVFKDFVDGKITDLQGVEKLEKFRSCSLDETVNCRNFWDAILPAANDLLKQKVEPNVEFNQRLGNSYTASLYTQIIKLIHRTSDFDSLNDKRILLFSYGSGCASAMFSIAFNFNEEICRHDFEKMQKTAARAGERMDSRARFTPEEYTLIMKNREDLIRSEYPIVPHALKNGKFPEMFPETYFLTHIGENFLRHYKLHP